MIRDITSQTQSPLRAALCMLGSTLAFSLMGMMVKFSTDRLPAAETAFARVFVNLLIILPVMWSANIPFLGSSRLLLFTRGLAGSLALGLSFYATSKIPLVDVVVLHKTSVFFTALLAGWMLREHISRAHVLYMLAGFCGACLVIKPTWHFLNFPGLAALVAGLMVSATAVSIRHLNKTEHPLTIVFAFCFYASIFFGVGFGETFLVPTSEEALHLVLVGVLGSIGQILLTLALRSAEASFVAPFAYLEVLFSGAIGVLIFSEFPDLLSFCGAGLILWGGFRLLRLKQRPAPASQPVEEGVLL